MVFPLDSRFSRPSPGHSLDSYVDQLRRAGCVFAEDEAALILSAARDADEVAAMVEQRVQGLPLEQVVGWAEFCGLRISVEAGVFVPRRRTEFLVQQAVALVPDRGVVVDLCCGSGAVGAAVADAAPVGELHVADIDPVAVRCARGNVAGVGGEVYVSDLYDGLPARLRGRVDVLVVNAPYVPTDAIGLLPPEARDYEPRVALDGGADGVDVQRRVAAGAYEWLAPGGRLLIETSERQADRTAQAMVDSGLEARVVDCSELGASVVVGGVG
jgi:release factor glutamine methyltransferase